MNKVLKLKNPSKENIVDYPIGEAVINPQTGDAEMDSSTGQPKWTGNTYEWSIKAGETLEFPAYVARYLKSVYDFLEIVEEKRSIVEKPLSVPRDGPVNVVDTAPIVSGGDVLCPVCKLPFKRSVQLGMHIGAKHPEFFKVNG